MRTETLCERTFQADLAARGCSIWFATTTLALPLLFLSALCTSAQTSASRKQDVSDYAELANAPQKARDRSNPLEKDRDAVAAGAKLFDLHCAQCHGSTTDGGQRGPSLRAKEVQQATPGALFWLLTNGVVRRGMPVWSKLPEPQRWQIVSYIKSLSQPESPVTP
jgi:mono/diheme cytochrome c family protein